MSQLKVNSIVPVGGLPSGANGGIIQVVQSVKTDTASSTADSFANIGPTVSITPSSNSNKILVRFTFVGFPSGSAWAHYFRLARGGSGISGSVGDSDGNRVQAGTVVDSYAEGSLSYIQTSFEFLDSPATTSAVTYSIQHKRAASDAGTFYLGRNDDDSNASSVGRFPSIITAMEVTV
tara:strand:+ start:722 stop:1255 length:534 start_codon:yes stop_codon:yes gene_type:complete